MRQKRPRIEFVGGPADGEVAVDHGDPQAVVATGEGWLHVYWRVVTGERLEYRHTQVLWLRRPEGIDGL